jgi:hypothetical protein
MILIVGAPSLLGYSVIRKLNDQNFNYLILSGEDPIETTLLTDDSFQFLHYQEYSVVKRWITEKTEEIEFIVWCDPVEVTKNACLFKALWQLGNQYQIPFAAVVYDERIIHDLVHDADQPFFWVMLIANYLYNLNERVLLSSTSSELQFASQPSLPEITTKTSVNRDNKVALTFAPDVAEVLYHFILNRKQSGLYRLPFQRLSGESLSQKFTNSPKKHWDKKDTEWPQEAMIAIQKFSKAGFDRPFTSFAVALDQFR